MRKRVPPSSPVSREFSLASPSWSPAVRFPAGHCIYAQGDPADHLYQIEEGQLKLSVVSPTGKEAILAVLGPGEIFGESSLRRKFIRLASATTMSDCVVRRMDRRSLEAALGGESSFSRQFAQVLLEREARLAATLLDRFFCSAEERLARLLLNLAGLDGSRGHKGTIPRISQTILARMVGTTRPRVNLFMNRFRRLGYIKYSERIEVSISLAKVLRETR